MKREFSFALDKNNLIKPNFPVMKNTVSALLLLLSLSFVACNNPEKPKTRDERIQEIVEKINNSPEWKSEVSKKAGERNLPLDTAIYYDAVWTVEDLDGLHKK